MYVGLGASPSHEDMVPATRVQACEFARMNEQATARSSLSTWRWLALGLTVAAGFLGYKAYKKRR
jgi:hypothetical protein